MTTTKIKKIPFRKRFRDVLLSGRKTWTARPRRMAAEGDRFWAFGAHFRVKSVVRVPLWYVANNWVDEGCDSQQDFIETWEAIHPRKGYQPEQLVWLHIFEKE